MKKEIEITVPKDWSAVSFKQYLKLQSDLKLYEDTPEAYEPTLLYHLCGLPPQLVSEIDTTTLHNIREDLGRFLNKGEEYPLKRFITIDGVEYGFEPNLSQMKYSAYLDLTSYENIELNESWPEILSILYRPVVSKKGALYEIQSYTGVNPWDGEKWEELGMDFHFGGFFFFCRLYEDLLNYTLKSTENLTGMSPNTISILQRNGRVMQRLHESRKKIF